MKRLSELAMADLAQRSKGRGMWKIGCGVLFVVFCYVLARNYSFVQQGMLKPHFGLIQQAYDFNLWQLPMALLGCSAVFWIVALIWHRQRKSLIWIGLLYAFVALDLLALRYYITSVEPQRLVVKRVRLQTPKLTAPLRILHISDIQSGGISDYEAEVFVQIQALQPDLILNTGDFLQVVPPATFESELPKLLGLIRDANPPLGSYGVFGDTERELYGIPAEQLKPLTMLSSRSAQINTGGGVIDLHGLSLYQSRNPSWATRSIQQWLESSNHAAFRIVFGHAPDYALEVGELPIDLCLAGHTHGGQVRLPGYGPLVIDSQVPRQWARGFRRIGIPYLNVSAGAGSNRFGGLPPMRFNCPTEMTVIELVPMRTVR
jgi:predicted MPP superfamily phosphohydrolase